MLDRRGVQDYRGFTDRSIANTNQVYDFATWEILNGGGNLVDWNLPRETTAKARAA